MKKFIACLIALMVIFSCVACGEKVEETVPTQETLPMTAYDSPALLISLSLTEEETGTKSIYAYLDEEGRVCVEYVGKEKKSGIMDASVLPGITYEIQKADFAALDGENVYNEGAAAASFYVYYGEEDFIGGGYTGTAQDIPQKFKDGYEAVDAYFAELLKNTEVYMPTDTIAENVDTDVRSELLKIFTSAGGAVLEDLIVEDVPMDEDFYSNTGLTSDGGVVNATRCVDMLIPATFSFVVITVEDSTYVDSVARDLAGNTKWFQAAQSADSMAYVAYKGQFVLCVIGTGDMYQQIVSGIQQNEWEAYPISN